MKYRIGLLQKFLKNCFDTFILFVKEHKVFCIVMGFMLAWTMAFIIYVINDNIKGRNILDVETNVVEPLAQIRELGELEEDEDVITALIPVIRSGKDGIVEHLGKYYAVITSGGNTMYDISYDIFYRIDGSSIITYEFDVETSNDTIRYKVFELSSNEGVSIVNLGQQRINHDISDGVVYAIRMNGECIYFTTVVEITGLERIQKDGIYSIVIDNGELQEYTEIGRLVFNADVLERRISSQMRDTVLMETATGTIEANLIKTAVEIGNNYEFTLTFEDGALYAEANRYK